MESKHRAENGDGSLLFIAKENRYKFSKRYYLEKEDKRIRKVFYGHTKKEVLIRQQI